MKLIVISELGSKGKTSFFNLNPWIHPDSAESVHLTKDHLPRKVTPYILRLYHQPEEADYHATFPFAMIITPVLFINVK